MGRATGEEGFKEKKKGETNNYSGAENGGQRRKGEGETKGNDWRSAFASVVYLMGWEGEDDAEVAPPFPSSPRPFARL